MKRVNGRWVNVIEVLQVLLLTTKIISFLKEHSVGKK